MITKARKSTTTKAATSRKSTVAAKSEKIPGRISKPKANSARSADDTRKRSEAPLSKQAKVLVMLREANGATLASIMKATGWQQHSVRGFFAGTIRKKLKLNLTSEKTDGQRVYRIAKSGPSK